MASYQRISETQPAGAAARPESLILVPEVTAPPTEPPPPYETPAASVAAAVCPPAASAAAAGGAKVAFEPPPAYDDGSNPAKPPSYAEVQQEKAREVVGLPPAGAAVDSAQDEAERANALHLWRISSVALDPETAAALKDEQLLGTDLMFFTAFLAAFLFNWIGFLLLLCFCHSVAGRYGALAGFGLSLAKWTLIVKNSTTLVSHDNSWLWWLIMSFGLVISVRAMLQYLYIKREWRQLSTAARHRLIFFY